MAGLRFLTDPTFDSAGTEYPAAAYTLRKTRPPAMPAVRLGGLDAVLLSHDHHVDNLDHAGRSLLARVPVVYTTAAGAERLGAPAKGLAVWEAVTLRAPDGSALRLTAVPARHGPPDGDRGPVIGFVLEPGGTRLPAVYVSGDTVLFEGVEEVGRRFAVAIAVLHMGAAKVTVAGPHPLTMTAEDAIRLARVWPRAAIIPVHYEGWEHFTEGRADIEDAFEEAGLAERLHWLAPGVETALAIPESW